jgi:hypothetical protein
MCFIPTYLPKCLHFFCWEIHIQTVSPAFGREWREWECKTGKRSAVSQQKMGDVVVKFPDCTFVNRVTRLGEITRIGLLFTLDSVSKITENWSSIWTIFSSVQVMCWFWQRTGWATFWATFFRTHLVTLSANPLPFTASAFSAQKFFFASEAPHSCHSSAECGILKFSFRA